ncbi:MAG TPA: tetratricopeptide repeat protein, partial [Thermoanaerobaculia bacterium]|nr:tetratricopeptide repeat protein [Thermoanaerobaculia bacterium]
LPLSRTLAIGAQIAEGLAAAHEAGIVHRDLKPENVMLLPDGRLKLLDFGLARSAGATPITELGLAVGTAAYMPPEAFGPRGERPDETGPAGDLWAFGTLLYETLAGERPFGGERQGMVHRILHEAPPALETIRPDLPPALGAIVRRCLAKAPAERPASAREILSDLASAGLWESTESGSARIAPIPAESSRPRHRSRFRSLLLVAALLGLAAAVALALFLYLRSRPAAPPVYVAVLEPKVTGPDPEPEHALIAANLQAAILRALAALDGVAAVESAQVKAVSGSTPQIARAVAAGEVVTAEAACAADLCHVRLRRLSGADGRVLWTAALQLPPSRPLVFAEAVAASIRRGYPERRARGEPPEFAIDEGVYRHYLALREQLANGRDLDHALAELEELRAQAPKMIEVYSLAASAARRRFGETGERRYLDRGLDLARQARKLAPDDPRPLASLFDLELQAGHLDEAQEILDAFEKIDPAAALLRRGQLAERRGHEAEAIELMIAAVRIQPSWRTLLVLANAEYRQGRLDAARRHLGELLDRSPGNVEGLRTLAQIELLNDPQRAADLLEQLVAKKPDAGSLSNLGLAFLLLRRYAEAETSFRRTLALDPHDPAALLNLADCLTLLGREAEARGRYREILSAAEPEPTLDKWPQFSLRAQAWAHLGETEKAIETIQKALRLTPDNAQLAFEASVVYIVIGDRGSALFHARRAAEAGLDPRWFGFSWFDPLRSDPAFPHRAS